MNYDENKVRNEIVDGIIDRAELKRPIEPDEFTHRDFAERARAAGKSISEETARRILKAEVEAGRLAVREASIRGKPGYVFAYRAIKDKI